MAIVRFPDGTRVRASSISNRCVDDPERTFGLYLDAHWETDLARHCDRLGGLRAP
jgi:hypothetical protein